jgi:hypothetical protein
MAGLYYFVRVAMSEDWVRFGSSQLLVQLFCEDHAKPYESDRERSACQLAREAIVDRHHSTAEDMGYADAKQIFRSISEPPIFLLRAAAAFSIGRAADKSIFTRLP